VTITLHVVSSIDGFIARHDNTVEWLDSPDDAYARGVSHESAAEGSDAIDCFVLGSRTYEHALQLGWPYGDKPTFVLSSRKLRKTRNSVEFHSGDLEFLVGERLKPNFRSIWFVGGGEVCGDCLRRGLADEVRYSIMPILIGDGISFFDRLDKDVALHLMEAKAYGSGMVALRYEVRGSRGE